MFDFSKDLPFSERIFWAHVLRRAVFDYVLFKGVGSRKLDWQRAFQYLFSPGLLYENGLSFEEVCGLFGWDPDHLRRVIPKLTRADIKKMETSSTREDFVYDEVAVAVEQTERWKTENFAVPFLPLSQYNREYRNKLMLKKVARHRPMLSPVPVVQWQMAV
jgi:hypothetical protein